jgi:hypothetical protein
MLVRNRMLVRNSTRVRNSRTVRSSRTAHTNIRARSRRLVRTHRKVHTHRKARNCNLPRSRSFGFRRARSEPLRASSPGRSGQTHRSHHLPDRKPGRNHDWGRTRTTARNCSLARSNTKARSRMPVRSNRRSQFHRAGHTRPGHRGNSIGWRNRSCMYTIQRERRRISRYWTSAQTSGDLSSASAYDWVHNHMPHPVTSQISTRKVTAN